MDGIALAVLLISFLVLRFAAKSKRPTDDGGPFSIANTSIAGSLNYLLVSPTLFALCFVLVASFPQGEALDKFSTGGFSKESWSCNPSSWGADVRNSGT
jgi:hypothetical protein